MREYRIASMPTILKKELATLGFNIIEEKFSNRKSWLLYSECPIEPLLDQSGVAYEVKDVADSGWETLWHNYLQSGWLTDNAYYCFQDKVFDDNRTIIRINPALAFGTGNHATTQIAARLLEPVVKGQTVLDIGTGSGILAILAEKNAAKEVYACDTDKVAVQNAKENIGLNSCGKIRLWAGGVESINPNTKITVVSANIITSVLLQLHPHILTLNPKYIIYSGIMKKEGDDFLASINMHGYQPDALLHMGEWSGLRFKMVS